MFGPALALAGGHIASASGRRPGRRSKLAGSRPGRQTTLCPPADQLAKQSRTAPSWKRKYAECQRKGLSERKSNRRAREASRAFLFTYGTCLDRSFDQQVQGNSEVTDALSWQPYPLLRSAARGRSPPSMARPRRRPRATTCGILQPGRWRASLSRQRHEPCRPILRFVRMSWH